MIQIKYSAAVSYTKLPEENLVKSSSIDSSDLTHAAIKGHHKICCSCSTGGHEAKDLFPQCRWGARRRCPRLIALLGHEVGRCTQKPVASVELASIGEDFRRASFVQVLGTPKPTNFRLSDCTIFQCLSHSASASAST